MNARDFLLIGIVIAALGGCAGYASRDACGMFNGSRSSCEFHDYVQAQRGVNPRWGF
jgi:hypothetical protein